VVIWHWWTVINTPKRTVCIPVRLHPLLPLVAVFTLSAALLHYRFAHQVWRHLPSQTKTQANPACMYACVYVCTMYVCMYVCMPVYVLHRMHLKSRASCMIRYFTQGKGCIPIADCFLTGIQVVGVVTYWAVLQVSLSIINFVGNC